MAAPAPIHGAARRDTRMNAHHTITAPQIGTTARAPRSPATADAMPMISPRPGAHIGARAPGLTAEGTNPVGASDNAAFDHEASASAPTAVSGDPWLKSRADVR